MQQDLHTILLIDDSYSKFIDGFAKIGKSDYGFTIRAFASIEAGLFFLDTNEKEIGAVLLDLSFTPNKYEGAEALQQIKKNHALLPVIMLSETYSKKDIKAAVNCMQFGAFNYAIKRDLNPATLFRMVQVAVAQYQENANQYRYNSLKDEYRSKISVFEQMLQTTELFLKNTLQTGLMFTPTFEKRVKDFESFYEKLLSKEKAEGKIDDPFTRLTDIAGVRVIFYNETDMEKAIERLTTDNDFKGINEENELKGDYKAKTHGYRAVHFDVKLNTKKRIGQHEYERVFDIPCEIQFKTIFAHSWSKIYHAFAYKEMGKRKLSPEQKEILDKDFKEAAKNLESIEQQITILCAKYSSAIEHENNGN